MKSIGGLRVGAKGARAARPGAQRYEEVLIAAAKFPDIPLEAVFKEDLLRLGVQFTQKALRLAARFKPKSYFIFSFDLVPLSELDENATLHAPEEMALVGGMHSLKRTIVSVRLNPASPYVVDAEGQRLILHAGDQRLCEVLLGPNPDYYKAQLSSGKSMREVAPTIEWGYLIYLTAFRLCQYFGADEECQFCDINENFRQQRKAGRPYHQVKDIDDILEALDIIVRAEDEAAAQERAGLPESEGPVLRLHRSAAYTLTGGSITSQLQGMDEITFYCRYVQAIESRYPGRWISKAVVQAHEKDGAQLLKDSGTQIYHPNYEVWDKELFAVLCPGKQRHVGRENWIRRILEARDVFGAGNVIPNFVAGVEMARPHGYTRVADALKSTAEGLDFFMSQGVVPRFTTWCPEPLSVLGRTQGPAPLEYHLGLLRVWRDTHKKYDLPAPPGYGEPGTGKAVFSVSAFMDVLNHKTNG